MRSRHLFVPSLLAVLVIPAFATGCSSSTEEEGSSLDGVSLDDVAPKGCDSDMVLPLAIQLADEAKCEAPGDFANLTQIDGVKIGPGPVQKLPYVHRSTADGLRLAIAERRETVKDATITVNSAYRTIAQQYVLYKLYKKGTCELAAEPAKSNHSSGAGLDIADYDQWKGVMEKNGFVWHGHKLRTNGKPSDPVHFDYTSAARKGEFSVRAFQRLWNRNHPEDLLTVDGLYGKEVDKRLGMSPASGFPVSPQCQPVAKARTSNTFTVQLDASNALDLQIRAYSGTHITAIDTATKQTVLDLTPGLETEMATLRGGGTAAVFEAKVTSASGGAALCTGGGNQTVGRITCSFAGPTKASDVSIDFAQRRMANEEALTLPLSGSKGPIPFVAFTYNDFTNPDTGRPYEATEKIVIKDTDAIIWQGTGEELLASINSAERHYCEMGQTLREMEDVDPFELARTGRLVDAQRGNLLAVRPDIAANKVKPPVASCPLVTLPDLGVREPQRMLTADGPMSSVSDMSSQLIDLGDGVKIPAGDLRDRLNDQQRASCEAGYDFVSGVETAKEDTLTKILARRDSVMKELGVSAYSKFWNLSTLSKLQSYADVASEIQDAIKNRELPSPEKLKEWAKTAGVDLPDAWKVPDLPNIPSPDLPKRADLDLKKRKTWDGLNLGNRSIAAVYSNAWYEVRGSEKSTKGDGSELDVRGEGKAGVFVVGKEANLIYGAGVFNAAPTGITGSLSMTVVGKTLVDEKINEKVSYSFSDKPWNYGDSWVYEQQFAVGPIPVNVRAELEGSMYLNYEVGINMTQIYGKLIPGAEATFKVQGGVGVSGLSAGAAGEIDLINVTVPITGTAALAFEDSLPVLNLSVRGDLDFSYLDGHMEAYAEWPWPTCSLKKGCRIKKKRATRELFRWEGERGTRHILDWGMVLRPFGAKMTGDLVDQTDREELRKLQDAATLAQAKLDTANAERAVIAKEAAVFGAIKADLESDTNRRVAEQNVAFQKAASDLDLATNDLIAVAKKATGQ